MTVLLDGRPVLAAWLGGKPAGLMLDGHDLIDVTPPVTPGAPYLQDPADDYSTVKLCFPFYWGRVVGAWPGRAGFMYGASPDRLTSTVDRANHVMEGGLQRGNLLIPGMSLKNYRRQVYARAWGEYGGVRHESPIVSASVESAAEAMLADPDTDPNGRRIAQGVLDAIAGKPQSLTVNPRRLDLTVGGEPGRVHVTIEPDWADQDYIVNYNPAYTGAVVYFVQEGMDIVITPICAGTNKLDIFTLANTDLWENVNVTVTAPAPPKNLLAYGPATGSRIKATVNADGTLAIDPVTTDWWAILDWTQPEPLPAGEYALSLDFDETDAGTDQAYVAVRSPDGRSLAVASKGTPATLTLTAPTVLTLRFGYKATRSIPLASVRMQLERGATPTGWARPDRTDLEGGGN